MSIDFVKKRPTASEIEPGTICLLSRRSNHYTTEARYVDGVIFFYLLGKIEKKRFSKKIP